ncbi:Ferric/cupric reductase transmembrane component 1 [Cytospora mali]|uniref:Ferric/cupric reductase transmembrane component 1 n=1 Tax=Cytospora mali TaxID=578113 RepID=A0A194VZP2_CYTMA|nr:Ferric/cupric reductase transmembrane component 1 [Valsa mali]
MATHETIIAGRMIQNFTDANASELQPHWGYANRLMPCTSDAGSCAYLDVVYHSHDLSMLYTGICWSAIGGILFLWGIGRRLFPSATADDILISTAGKAESQGQGRTIGGVEKLKRTVASLGTRYLLPEFAPRLLGHVTRLQVLVMLVLAGYLTIFSFVGIVYNTWVTPVSSSPGSYNIRTSLGPFADRIGVLAYALTPLSVLLSSRESLLSLVTGIPYQSFMFLHRWVGYIILIQSSVHTLGWVIVEARLYQPQPSSWNAVAGELYIQWGFVALGLLVLLWLLATPWGIRLTGYEFFRKAHYVLAMVYIGAIIGHWQNLQCFLIPGILLWFFDRLGRWIRTGLLHYQWVPSKGRWGFETAKARVTYWDDEETGNVVRLDFDHVQQPWEIGQHFYLCFTESSIWQSHPMTPLSLPVADKLGRVRHSYVIRAKKGETKKLADIAAKKMAAAGEKDSEVTTSVVLTGPYGVDMVSDLTPDMNVLCVAGGTGITFVLPVLLRLMREKRVPGRKARLVWAVRRDVDVKWVEQELEEIKEVGCSQGIKVDVFVTREKSHHRVRTAKTGEDSKAAASASSSASSSGEGCDCNDVTHHHASNIDVPEERRPHLDDVVKDFVGSVERGSTTVYASGPGGMIGDLRRAVAGCNGAGRVWKGEGRGDVRLICDDRLE